MVDCKRRLWRAARWSSHRGTPRRSLHPSGRCRPRAGDRLAALQSRLRQRGGADPAGSAVQHAARGPGRCGDRAAAGAFPTDRPLSRAGATETKIELTIAQTVKGEFEYGINGIPFSRTRCCTPAGETQIWHVVNSTAWSHPFHLHGFFFQVLDEGGQPVRPLAWKDTVNVPFKSALRIAVRFDADRLGEWMFHCHVLDHADGGLIGTVLVGDPQPGSSTATTQTPTPDAVAEVARVSRATELPLPFPVALLRRRTFHRLLTLGQNGAKQLDLPSQPLDAFGKRLMIATVIEDTTPLTYHGRARCNPPARARSGGDVQFAPAVLFAARLSSVTRVPWLVREETVARERSPVRNRGHARDAAADWAVLALRAAPQASRAAAETRSGCPPRALGRFRGPCEPQ